MTWRIALLIAAVSLQAPLRAAEPPAGHFEGRGRIVVNWTTQRELPVDIQVSPQGTVTGVIGDAEVVEGRVVENPWHSRLFIHADFTIHMRLRGLLVAQDEIVRKEFHLHMNREGGQWTGFGFSDGNKSWPGASKETMMRGMTLQTRKFVLTRTL